MLLHRGDETIKGDLFALVHIRLFPCVATQTKTESRAGFGVIYENHVVTMVKIRGRHVLSETTL